MSFYLHQSPSPPSTVSSPSLVSYHESEILAAIGHNTRLSTMTEEFVDPGHPVRLVNIVDHVNSVNHANISHVSCAAPIALAAAQGELPPSYSRVSMATPNLSVPSNIESGLFHPPQPSHRLIVASIDPGCSSIAQVEDPLDVPLCRTGGVPSGVAADSQSGIRMDRQMRELVSIYTPHSGTSRSDHPVISDGSSNSPFRNRARASIRGEALPVVDHSAIASTAVAAQDQINNPNFQNQVAAGIAAEHRVAAPGRGRSSSSGAYRDDNATSQVPSKVDPIPPPVGPPSPIDLVARVLANLPMVPDRRPIDPLEQALQDTATRPSAQSKINDNRGFISRTSSFTWSSFRSTPRESRAPIPPPKDPPPVPPRARPRFHIADACPRMSRRVTPPRSPPPPVPRKDTGLTAKSWFTCTTDPSFLDVNYRSHFNPAHHTYETFHSTSPDAACAVPRNAMEIHARTPSASLPPSPPDSALITPFWPGETGTCPPPVPPKPKRQRSDPELSSLIQECRGLILELTRVRAANNNRRRMERLAELPTPPVPPRPTGPPVIHVPEEVYAGVRSRRRFALARAASMARRNSPASRPETAFSNDTTLVGSTSIHDRVGQADLAPSHVGPQREGSRRTRYMVERPLLRAGSFARLPFGRGVSTISIGQFASSND